MVAGVQSDDDDLDGLTDPGSHHSQPGAPGLEVVDLPDEPMHGPDHPPQCSPHLSHRQVE